MDPAVVKSVRRKYKALRPVLDERARRQWAAAESLELGWGGITAVAEATGMSRVTITTGIGELKERQRSRHREETGYVRRPGGGSNSHRSRLWKVALQELADEIGLKLSVCHFPPGTSKWNKVEHRLFAFITQNWRGKPLVSRQAIVELIGSTTTRQGLKVHAAIDTNTYVIDIKVSDAEMERLKLIPHEFQGDWNYTIKPRK